MDIDKEFDSFFEFDTDDKSQVTSTSCKLFAEHVTDKLRKQLAVKDLEVMQLRGALEVADKIIYKAIVLEDEIEPYISESTYELNGALGESAAHISVHGNKVRTNIRELLSTTFTPYYLREWLGEPYCWEYRVNNSPFARWSHEQPPEDAYDEGTLTPLYAPKLEIK